MRLPASIAYPGGKHRLAPWVCDHLVRVANGKPIETLVEPFAGGAHVALDALRHGTVERVRLSDADPHLANFWTILARNPDAIIEPWFDHVWDPDEYIEWHDRLYPIETRDGSVTAVQSAFWRFMIRIYGWCGRPNSGVRRSGVPRIPSRVTMALGLKRDHRLLKNALVGEECSCADWSDVVAENHPGGVGYFLDPPYFEAARQVMYPVNFDWEDHLRLRRWLRERRDQVWALTYGDDLMSRSGYEDWCDVDRHVRHQSMATSRRNPERRYDERADLIITPTGWTR